MAKTSKRASHPWVAAATVCEAVLEEKDNVFSIIRMVDVFTVPTPPGWDGANNLHIPLRGIVAFRSGEVKGTRTVRIYSLSLAGKRQKLIEIEPDFLGGNTGLNIKFNLLFGFRSAGTHWLDVYV
jgi:hypothetical protein